MNETSGPKPSESFASYDPDTHSWRTYQVSFLTNTLAPYSESWPKQGTMRNGAVSRRRKSVPATNANGSSSWPTPNAGPQNDSDTKWKERRQRIKAEKRNGNGFGLTLGMAVSEWWPTPTTRDYKDGTSAETVPENGLLGRVAPNRVNSDRWPTPKQRDSLFSEAETKRHSPDLPTIASLQAPTTSTPGHECSPKCRRLNPLSAAQHRRPED